MSKYNLTQTNKKTFSLAPISWSDDWTAPVLSLSHISDTSLRLSWTFTGRTPEGYYIERSTNGTTYTNINDIDGSLSYYNDTGLTANTLYYYRIRAYFHALLSDYSNVVSDKSLLFFDSCDGVSPDLTKWTFTNGNAYISLIQNNGIELKLDKAYPGSGVANYFSNYIKSSQSSATGTFGFSAGHARLAGNTSYYLMGLMADTNNRIEFFTDTVSKDIGFRIISAGANVYNIDSVVTDFGQFKIVVTAANAISAYLWTDDEWVQIGETQTASMGAKSFFLATRGYNIGLLQMNNVFISTSVTTAITPIVNHTYTDARDYDIMPDGTTDNAEAINAALEEEDIILQNGVFAIGSSILLPSNRSLYIRNAKILLLDASYDNIFRNADPVAGNSGFNFIGLGLAVLDGNGSGQPHTNYDVYGGLVMSATGLYKANIMFLGRATDFEISGLINVDRVAYFGCVQESSEGSIHDIYLNHYTVIRNQDGIQSCAGTRDIDFYNIYGYTADDMLSCFLGTTFPSLWYNYGGSFYMGDIKNVTINNIENYKSTYHIMVFITGDGNKIHDITINDVYCTSCLFFGYFGLGTSYNTVPCAADDFYNIIIDNLTVRSCSQAVLQFNDDCRDVTITDFVNSSGQDDYSLIAGDQSDNVTINGVQVS